MSNAPKPRIRNQQLALLLNTAKASQSTGFDTIALGTGDVLMILQELTDRRSADARKSS